MELTLGSLQFNWPADAWSDFYARIADEAPVDRVVIGELICSKRLPFYADRIGVAVERLQRAGKRVTLASLALITLPRERHAAASLFADGETEVEINDLTLMRWARGVPPFSIGPLVNVYNESTLRFLARRGARSICLPPELPFASVRALADAARETHIGSRSGPLAARHWRFPHAAIMRARMDCQKIPVSSFAIAIRTACKWTRSTPRLSWS